MAVRVTAEQVKAIIETDLGSSEIDPFITAASLMVDRITGLSDSVMLEIERWLAAHFVAVRDPRFSQETTGKSKATYAIKVGLGLDGSTYGQQVKLLDSTGTLANLGKKKMTLEAY